MGADRFFNSRVKKHRTELFTDEIEEEFRVELFKFDIKIFGTVVLQLIAQTFTLN